MRCSRKHFLFESLLVFLPPGVASHPSFYLFQCLLGLLLLPPAHSFRGGNHDPELITLTILFLLTFNVDLWTPASSFPLEQLPYQPIRRPLSHSAKRNISCKWNARCYQSMLTLPSAKSGIRNCWIAAVDGPSFRHETLLRFSLIWSVSGWIKLD